MGKISKGITCSVSGCSKPAVRSIAGDKVAAAKLDVGNVRRAYICDEHYKIFKKRLKKDIAIEKLRWSVT